MDLPTEVVDAVEAAVPDAPRARVTRSAQRRRAAAVAGTAPDASPAAHSPPAHLLAPLVDEPAPSTLASIEAELTDAVSFNPPAATVADTKEEDPMTDMNDTAATAQNDAEQLAGRGQAALADMNGRAKEAMEKTTRMAEELSAFGKGNLEAIVESSKIVAKGLEAMSQEAAEFSRKSIESATTAMKTLAATRSPTEFMKLQSDYARSMFDTMVAETSKSTEMMLKLANEVAQPLSNRVALAAEKMKVSG